MSKLKKSLFVTLVFIVLMTVLIVTERIRLNDMPMPYDDVELRFRGVWMLMAVISTTIGSVVVFAVSFLSLTFFQFIKKMKKESD